MDSVEAFDAERRHPIRLIDDPFLRLLVDGGRLIIGDEVVPSWPRRALHLLLRLPLVIVTYILTQTTTRAVAELRPKITDAGFKIRWTNRSLLGDFETVAAVKSGMG